MKQHARIEVLRKVWLFERCSRKELSLLASNATPLHLPAGKVLAREGDVGREFFIITAGKAEATRNGALVATLTAGSFFGEMALLESAPRVATVTALEPLDVLVLAVQAFNGVVSTMPSVDRKMLTVLATRIRDLETRFLPMDERLLDAF